MLVLVLVLAILGYLIVVIFLALITIGAREYLKNLDE